MRQILKRELARVLERRGLKHREWAIEWESSALEFLLDRGFTPTMGARPLKRVIDQYLLAPLAVTIVEHRAPTGEQFLFVRSDGLGIQVEFVDPDAPAAGAENTAELSDQCTLASIIITPSGTATERSVLNQHLEQLQVATTNDAWETLRADLLGQMQAAEFWNRPDRHRVLARYALVDRIKAAAETASGLARRVDRSLNATQLYSRELMQRLALQLYLLRLGIEDVQQQAPVEVALLVQPAMETPVSAAAQHWCHRLADMYRQWANQRRMQLSELASSDSQFIYVIAGFGAARILQPEQGLHVLESGKSGDIERVVARVKVVATSDPQENQQHEHARFICRKT